MKQKGFILVVSLIFMAVMSILAIYMFSGFTTDAVLSANSREKSRALDATQSALDNAALWLGTGVNTYNGAAWVTGTSCSSASAVPVICSNPLTAPATLPWPSYTSFTPTGMTVNASGGAANIYAANTQYYIQYLGTLPGSVLPTALYQVTATAQGGNATATSVVQAVYQVQTNSSCATCP